MNPVRIVLVLALAAGCSASGTQGRERGKQRSTAGGEVALRPPADPPVEPRDWLQFGGDAARSSASPAPTGITADNVAALRRRQVALDGIVDASVIYLHGAEVGGAPHDAFFVTTTYGRTLAIDAASGAILWRYTPPGYDTWAGSAQITNATPAADPDRRFIYAASPDGRIQKLAVADGHPVWSTAITRLPAREKIASSLGVYHGRVIATTGGYIGDAPPYQGHVVLLDARTGRVLGVWNSLCSDRREIMDPSSCPQSGSAIWGRAGAVIDSSTGDLFLATGNGRWDGRTNWGDAVIELDSAAERMLGNYTPANTDELDARDADVGSTSPALLGGGYVAQGGKDHVMRLLDASVMRGAGPHRGGELQTVPMPSRRMFTAPAVWRDTSGTWLFAADDGGTVALKFDGGRLQDVWRNDNAGTSPVLSGGLLYVYDPGGALNVYDPGSGRRITRLECGEGHWNSPIVVDGRIALPEGNANDHSGTGVLDIWSVR